jgi:hypothetical protein
MFNSKNVELKIGEPIVVGYTVDKKFVPVKGRVVVSNIFRDSSGVITYELDWGSNNKSKIRSHDEGKYWVRAQNFN